MYLEKGIFRLSQALDTWLPVFIHSLEAVWYKKRWLKSPKLNKENKYPGADTPCFTHYLPTKAGSYE